MVSLASHSNFTVGDLERFMGLSVGFDSMFNRLANFPHQQESGSSTLQYPKRRWL